MQKFSLDQLLHQTKGIDKLPVHVSLVFLEENVQTEDLVKPIVWCICLGVSTITLYDYWGRIRQNKELNQEIHTYYNEFTAGSKSPQGCKKLVNPTINILSVENGRTDLVMAARELCTDVLKGYLPTSDITQDTFASYHKVLKHSEPDLLIKFGTVNSLAGYPPWPARLTEIISVPTCSYISQWEFIRVLNKYAKTEQRIGK